MGGTRPGVAAIVQLSWGGEPPASVSAPLTVTLAGPGVFVTPEPAKEIWYVWVSCHVSVSWKLNWLFVIGMYSV